MSRPDIAPLVDRRVKAGWLARLGAQEDLNFLLTNRVPRALLTRLMGRVSRIESRWFTRLAIAVWRRFTVLDLSDARQQRFSSLRACFTRELVPGARPFDARSDVLASPRDAIVGACGTVSDDQVLQAKGMAYSIAELFGPSQDPRPFADVLLHLRHRGPNEMPCHARLAKGQEMGWFEHGSTIIVFAPPGIVLAAGVVPGLVLRAGQPLLRVEAGRHRGDTSDTSPMS